MVGFIISCDIAQRRDYTALQVYRRTPTISRTDDKEFVFQDLVYQAKWQGITYTDLAHRLVQIVNRRDVVGNNTLLVDGTGVGVAVVDVLRDNGLLPVPIVATSGGQARPLYANVGEIFKESGKIRGMQTIKEWHVPKVEMVQSGQVAMEQQIVRVAPNVDYLDDFKEQLFGFKGKFNEKTHNTKYENETEGLHDDFITCYLQAMWWVYHGVSEQRVEHGGKDTVWVPF